MWFGLNDDEEQLGRLKDSPIEWHQSPPAASAPLGVTPDICLAVISMGSLILSQQECIKQAGLD